MRPDEARPIGDKPIDTTRTSDSNLLGLDYAAESERLQPLPFPIIDVHTHLSGNHAVAVFARAALAYGIQRVYSMTPLEELDAVSAVLGDRVRFIAIPDIFAPDRWRALTDGYAQRLRQYYDKGARIAKFWSAPRGIDFAEAAGAPPSAFRLDAAHVQANMSLAVELGMRLMVHIGDPDTWFATHYANTARYGSKVAQYEPLEMCLERFPVPIIAAHMGGWPEDLDFLDRLLSRHANLYLDTSATKWIVRELSRQDPEVVVQFFSGWQDRLLFGSDIVTRNAHLTHEANDAEEQKAASAAEAFDLYASRYWALRMLFESSYDGPSPIADPDLCLVEPHRYTPHDGPKLKGFAFPLEVLRSIYSDTPQRLLDEVQE